MVAYSKWLVLGGLILVGCESKPTRPEPTPEQRAAAQKLADEIKAFGDKADPKRLDVLKAALDGPMPAEAGSCPIKVPLPDSEALLGGREGDLPANWRSVRAEQMTLVPAERARTTAGKRWAELQKSVQFMVERGETPDYMRSYTKPEGWGWELIVVADKYLAPKITSESEFRPGLVVGRAFVYSFVEERMVCAARVLAENSDLHRPSGIKTDGGSDWTLDFDLENEAYRAAVKALYAVGSTAAPTEPSAATVSASASASASIARPAVTRPH
jgi:hypothetical protein